MFTAQQVKELLQARLSRPVGIWRSDRAHHDSNRRDRAWVTRGTVEVNLEPEGFAECAARCSLLHLTRLEDPPEAVAF